MCLADTVRAFKKAFHYRNKKKSVRDIADAAQQAAGKDVKLSQMSNNEMSMQALKQHHNQLKEEPLDDKVAVDSSFDVKNQATDEENISQPSQDKTDQHKNDNQALRNRFVQILTQQTSHLIKDVMGRTRIASSLTIISKSEETLHFQSNKLQLPIKQISNKWQVCADYKSAVIAPKKGSQMSMSLFDNDNLVAELLTNNVKNVLEAYGMPTKNMKTTTRMTNPILNMVSIRGPRDDSSEQTLCVNTNILKKENQVQIHTKVAVFIERKPIGQVSLDRLVKIYLTKKLNHIQTCDDLATISNGQKEKAVARSARLSYNQSPLCKQSPQICPIDQIMDISIEEI